MPPTADLTALPNGDMGWRAYVNTLLAAAPDDRMERDFLELKSRVDLTEKAWRARVAKFILGAANRIPVKAAEHLDGHAVMVLGVSPPDVVGVPPFDDQDLHRDVTSYIGVDGPAWDYHRVTTPDGDVILIDVAPPVPGSMWPCQKEGDGLINGAIYVRAGAQTRQANADEMAGLIERVRNHQPDVEIDVRLVDGVAWRPTYDRERIVAEIESIAARLRSVRPQSDHGSILTGERRSIAGYDREIAEWVDGAMAAIPTAVRCACSTLSPCIIMVRNRATRWLTNPQVAVTVDAPGAAIEARDADTITATDAFPEPPALWNSFSGFSMPQPYLPAPPSAANDAGWIFIVDLAPGEGVELQVRFDNLRPERDVESDPDVVLIVDSSSTEEVLTGSWSLTAADINAVYRGALADTVPIESVDLTEAVLSLLQQL